ncbi:MAG: hypothetical protein E7675_06105 [Ruminococcaceae bacterium]|nr:hypothetical protein [Oscillospiraceae bacterium]
MKEIFTSFYFIAPLCIAAIILGIYIIRKSTKILIRERLNTTSNKGVGYVYDILSTEFSSSKVLKDARFIPEASSSKKPDIKPTSDIVFVDKCGVLLITVITEKGEFDNPKTGEWKYRFADAEGKVQIQRKQNPFDATIPQIRIISELLNNEGIYSKCIKRIVVYTQSKVRFTYNYSEIIGIEKLIPMIHKMNSSNELTPSEARVAVSSIADYVNYLENN